MAFQNNGNEIYFSSNTQLTYTIKEENLRE